MFESTHICRESMHRCHADPKFLDLFYNKFLSSSDAIKLKFANTDFDRQKQVLDKSVHMTILSSGGHDDADNYLAEIAKRHGRTDLDIPPNMYDLWLEALLETVREIDPEFTPEIEQAWRETTRQGIDYMIENA